MGDLWDPLDHQDPVRALAQHIRGMPIGHKLRLSDGTIVKSVPMRHGATQVRRFAVSRKGKDPLPRVALRTNTHATAEGAAKVALGGKEK
jgi:hypothetical protein